MSGVHSGDTEDWSEDAFIEGGGIGDGVADRVGEGDGCIVPGSAGTDMRG